MTCSARATIARKKKKTGNKHSCVKVEGVNGRRKQGHICAISGKL